MIYYKKRGSDHMFMINYYLVYCTRKDLLKMSGFHFYTIILLILTIKYNIYIKHYRYLKTIIT